MVMKTAWSWHEGGITGVRVGMRKMKQCFIEATTETPEQRTTGVIWDTLNEILDFLTFTLKITF